MKIKRLEILGFKSFADKTVVEFERGITGIVGPNGCGKSNIVDAIRWVMGEMSPRHLRGKSMEDIIFAGTEKRPATNFAEVSLVFSTEDGRIHPLYAQYPEVAVRRRLHRDGLSEYAINGVDCRLKDIHDLFLGTGVGVKAYSIIEQGRVGQIVSSKPEERRLILEEAAGISKFKQRQEAATRKIEATRANLLRLSDLLSELQRQKNSLDRQAKKAEKYREIETELRELELQLWSKDFLELSSKLKVLEQQLASDEQEEAQTSAKAQELENSVESHRLKIQELEQNLSQLQEKIYEKNNSIQLDQARLDFKAREIQTLREQSQTAHSEIQLAQQRLEERRSHHHQLQEARGGFTLELNQAQESQKALEIKLPEQVELEKKQTQNIDQQNSRFSKLQQEETSAQQRLKYLEERQNESIETLGRHERDLTELQNQQKQLEERRKNLETQLRQAQQLKLNLNQEVGQQAESLKQKKEQIKIFESELLNCRGQLSQKKSRLESLLNFEKNFEGYREGVRQVLLGRGRELPQEIYGTLADVLEIDSQYEIALSAALGEQLQYVLVQNAGTGIQALDFLKSKKKGRLTCLPLGLSRSASSAASFSSAKVIAPLRDLIRIQPEYQPQFSYLLEDIYLVANAQDAQELWNLSEPKVSFVTLEGEMFHASGAISGGSQHNSEQALLEKKRQIKELQQEVEALEQELKQREEQVLVERREIEKFEKTVETLRRDSQREEVNFIQLDRDNRSLDHEKAGIDKRLQSLQAEVERLKQSQGNWQTEQAQLQARKMEVESEKTSLQTEIEGQKQALANFRQELEELRRQWMEAKSALLLIQEKNNQQERERSRLEQEIQQLERSLADNHQKIQNSEQKIQAFEQEILEHRESLQRQVQEQQALDTQNQALKIELGEAQAQTQTCEIDWRQWRQKLETIRASLQQRIREVGEGRTQVQILKEQIFERYHLDLAEIAPQYQDSTLVREEAEPRAAELRDRIAKLGSVNIDAIEEFKEVSERFEFLNQQHQDLDQSLNKLQQALQKVHRTTKKHLQDSFDKVNQLFQEVFPKVFQGGHAELRLTDPENILESGIEIVAQPPGKKLQNVTLLSGGEKALTAISLVFAIFLLKPSPFCLLDEVDAPLDDVNVERFNDIVKSMVDRSQFILITHNKRTMEMADVLYGVTMEHAGVSKMVSVALN